MKINNKTVKILGQVDYRNLEPERDKSDVSIIFMQSVEERKFSAKSVRLMYVAST